MRTCAHHTHTCSKKQTRAPKETQARTHAHTYTHAHTPACPHQASRSALTLLEQSLGEGRMRGWNPRSVDCVLMEKAVAGAEALGGAEPKEVRRGHA